MAIATETSDKRVTGLQNPVARLQFEQASWVTGAGHAAVSKTIFVSGTIYRMDVIISSVTANPTVALTFTDDNSVSLAELNQVALADGTNHTFDSVSHKGTADADFNPVTHHGDLSVSIDPSADPGGAAQTLTVDVILYVR
jgi:hypothetical protein